MKKIKEILRAFYRSCIHEFTVAIHDPGIVLFFLFLPLAYPVIYSLIYNPEVVRNVPMVVIDNDRSAESRKLVRMLDATEEVWVRGYAADLPEARRAMDSKQCFSILEIPEGYGRDIGREETANAVLYSDMTLLLRYRGTLVAATDMMQEIGNELLVEKIDEFVPLASTVVSGDLLPIENISMGNTKNGFDTFVMPGVIVLILHQCIVLAIGMSGGAKRESLKLAGYNPVALSRSTLVAMLAQCLCYMTLLILPVIYMFHYVPLMFGFPMAGNFFQEMMLLLPMCLACCAIGFVFQAFVTERESVFVTWVITSLLFLLLSGLIWPRYDMYGFWKALSAVCPSTWGVEGFVKMETNGARLYQVVTEYRNLWILAAGWWVVAWVCQRWRVRPAIMAARGYVAEK